MGLEARTQSINMKEQVVTRWVARRLTSTQHERRVRAHSEQLFRLLHTRHRLDRFAWRMLRLGSLLHDVGRAVNDRRHPQIGAEMILVDRTLPLNEIERRCLAYLTRYHRGAVPEIGYDDVLRNGDPRRAMRMVMAILRAADALDGRQHEPPHVRMKLRGDKLKLRCHLPTECRKAKKFFSRRKKFRLLEELLNLKVDLAVRESAVVA